MISNPSLPYIGLLLVLCALIPTGEPLTFRSKPGAGRWYMPWGIYATAWILMAAGYTFSGCIKLSSPSWIDGTALTHLINNPLARPGIFRDLFLAMPEFVAKLSTWSVLVLEILFIPLCFHRKTRLFAWLTMMIMHLGIVLMVNFADLSLGMIMIHLFTFDPAWLPARGQNNHKPLVLFDGVCGLCDRTIQFLIGEDTNARLSFAPLQGKTAAEIFQRHGMTANTQSIVFVKSDGTLEQRSQAILLILDELGGIWRIVSWLRIIPRTIRDRVYDWIAHHRYEWFGKHTECLIPTLETRERILQ